MLNKLKTKNGKPMFTNKLLIIILILFSITIYHDFVYNEQIKYDKMFIICPNGTTQKVYMNTTFACELPCQYSIELDKLQCGLSQIKLN